MQGNKICLNKIITNKKSQKFTQFSDEDFKQFDFLRRNNKFEAKSKEVNRIFFNYLKQKTQQSSKVFFSFDEFKIFIHKSNNVE